MAAHKLILCASNQQLIAGVWTGTRLQLYSTFEDTEDGYEAFQAFISKYKTLKAYLIADAVEEEYRLESLPHVTGSAKKELLNRKLEQFNRKNLFRTAHFISQDKDKRRDDNYLFVALTNADFLQGWMNILQVNEVPLVGLYLLPMISQYIVQQMKLGSPDILLCERLSSGLRQTYLSDGHLRMSRMVPMTGVKPNQIAYFYVTEIGKTRMYLLSQRFINEDTELDLVLPSLDSESSEVANSLSQQEQQAMECRLVDSLTYAKNINIAPELVEKSPELLHMQLLANGNMPANLAPEELTKTNQLFNIKRGINIATALAAIFGFFMIGYSLLDAQIAITEKDSLVEQTLSQEKLYASVAKDFPEKPVSSQALQSSVELANLVREYNQHTPEEAMMILSQALALFPQISVQRIHWVQHTDSDIKDEPFVNEDTQSAGEIKPLLQIAFINAEILGFNGDYRAAIESTNQFVAKLKAFPKITQVEILQEPVNVSSLAKLQGSTKEESQSTRSSAIFKLKVVLSPQATEGGVI